MTKIQKQLQNESSDNAKNIEKAIELATHNKTQQNTQKLKGEAQSKKKIIKKFPFSSKLVQKVTSNSAKDEEDLKDWKPTSIKGNNTTNGANLENNNVKRNKEIFNHFLTSLPKPKSQNGNKNLNAEPNSIFSQQNKLKKGHKQIYVKPTEQQLKWDADDQFLAKHVDTYNNFDKEEKPSYRYTHQAQEKQRGHGLLDSKQEDDNEVVEKIVWLEKGDEKGWQNSRDSNIAQLVSKTWEKQDYLLKDDDFDSDSSEKKKKKATNKLTNSMFKFK